MTEILVSRPATRRPKSRTGCVACKRRHIKCDEGEPACQRCEKAGLACDYAFVRPRSRNSKGHRQLAPAPLAAPTRRPLAPVQYAHVHPAPPSLPPARPPVSLFGADFDATKSFYYDVFRGNVLPRLIGHGHLSDFWCRTVFRESMHDACVRDCIVAIGALDLAHQRQPSAGPRLPLCAPLMRSAARSLQKDHARGLQHYTSALSQFRTRMASGGHSMLPRDILVVSILFILVESTHGDDEAVDRLYSSTMMVLKDKMKDPGQGLPLEDLSGPSIVRPVDDLGLQQAGDFFLRAASFRGLCSPMKPSNPLRWADDFYLRFDPPTMPLPSSHLAFEQIQYLWGASFARVTKWFIRVYRVTLLGDASPEYLQVVDRERAFVLSHCEQWAALAHERSKLEVSPPRRVFWQIVWARARVNYLFTSVLLDTTECGWDNLVTESHELLDRAGKIVEEPGPGMPSGCLFDDQIFPVVSCVVVKCRNYEVRQKGLMLCRRLMNSNRTWQNMIALMRLEASCAAEERSRNTDDGFIPSTSRYWAPSSRWDSSFSLMTVTNRRVGANFDDEIDITRAEFDRLLAKPDVEGFASIVLRSAG